MLRAVLQTRTKLAAGESSAPQRLSIMSTRL